MWDSPFCTDVHWAHIFKGLFTTYKLWSSIINNYLKKIPNNLRKSTRNVNNRRKIGRTPCCTIINLAKSRPSVNNYLLNINYTGYINSSSGVHTCLHTTNQISFRSSVCSSVTEVGFAYVKNEEKKTPCACLVVPQSIENPGGKRHENSRREWQLTKSICTTYRRTIIVITCLFQAICLYNSSLWLAIQDER